MFKAALFLFICLWPCVSPAKQVLQIFVSIPAQRFLVKRIGQDKVEVQVMLKPGSSPETFDPSLRQIISLNSAQLYFRIGVAFEKKWIDGIENKHAGIRIIACCENILKQRRIISASHIWTSVRNARLLAASIKQELIKIDPVHTAYYEQNYVALLAELEQLDKEIVAMLSQRRTDYFVISHAALDNFADDYGLVQLPLESQGKEVGAKGLIDIIRRARQEEIHTLFVEKQHNTATAGAFAREINAKIIEIDLLREDIISNLRDIAKQIAGATR